MFANYRGALVVLCLLSCGDDDLQISIPPRPDAASMDAGRDDGAVRECNEDIDCSDGIDCTVDTCTPAGECISFSDASRCSDGVFCNGIEGCDPNFGCRPGIVQTCNDDEVCTIDRCDEAAKRCEHRPRDFDGDGEVDFRCSGGTDCNDFDPTQGRLAPEICADGIDNDCDEQIDEADCGGPPHDTCEDALDISGGGSFLLELRGARSDFGLSCGSVGDRDLVLRFTLDEAADVALDAQGLWADGGIDAASVAVRSNCGDAQTEVTCASGFPARARTRALPAGQYSVIVSSTVNAHRILVRLQVEAPTEAPTNVDCSAPVDLGEGARIEADFVDVGSSLDLSCGFNGSPDLTYVFDVPELSDVVVATFAPTGERINVSLRTACDDGESEVRCVTGAPAFGRFRSLPAGRYFLIVEGPFSHEVDFSLDVRLEAPTEEPAGDSCVSAIDLPFDTMLSGSLTGKQDLVETCGFFYRDAVYALSVSAPTDVRVVVDSGNALVTLALQGECGDIASQLSCTSNVGPSTRVRNVQPGNYTVVVEAAVDTSYSVVAETLPLSVPVTVDGNDTCGSAFDVPLEGGLFVGSTLLMLADYRASCGGPAQSNDAVFKLVLPETRRVRATLEGAHDTVLYRFHNPSNATPSVCVPFGESACNDDFGVSTRSVLDETLSAGTHYYVVSGFGVSNSGAYTLEVDTAAQ